MPGISDITSRILYPLIPRTESCKNFVAHGAACDLVAHGAPFSFRLWQVVHRCKGMSFAILYVLLQSAQQVH